MDLLRLKKKNLKRNGYIKYKDYGEQSSIIWSINYLLYQLVVNCADSDSLGHISPKPSSSIPNVRSHCLYLSSVLLLNMLELVAGQKKSIYKSIGHNLKQLLNWSNGLLPWDVTDHYVVSNWGHFCTDKKGLQGNISWQMFTQNKTNISKEGQFAHFLFQHVNNRLFKCQRTRLFKETPTYFVLPFYWKTKKAFARTPICICSSFNQQGRLINRNTGN